MLHYNPESFDRFATVRRRVRLRPPEPITPPMSDPSIPEITVQELNAMLDAGQSPFILDVREEREYAIANLGGHLIPLGQLVDHVDELMAHQDDPVVVVHCRSGGRSAQAVRFLQACGMPNVKNLRGGTLAWSKEIDPSVPTY